ncbi:glycosyltransferase family 4 protein [Mycobacterium sp. 3519A]|uniref:glycosyltransferase family 4 protein n=1 Tax=Mycobacterium sp. 3519A TaxID=2057184 RepID=UPI001358AF15|nr:glycosyltransferase family 4 protein [Mycobacterium sp. 3519A]
MKVTLVTSLRRGGPITHARLLAGDLCRLGAAVTAVVVDEQTAASFAAEGADVVLAGTRRLGGDAVAACRDADVVHSHDRRSALWVLGRARMPGRVRIHTLHGLPEPYLPIPGEPPPTPRDRVAYQIAEPALLRRADRVIVPSTATRRLAGKLGHRAARIAVVHNGIRPRPPVPQPADGAIGVIGILDPVKGVDVFLEAAALVRARDPTAHFVIAGDGPERARLIDLTDHLGLGSAVRFLGAVPSADAVFRELAVAVVSSHFESCSYVALEAIAAGVPLVATRCGGLPEVVPADDATFVPPGDPEALADAILAVRQDRESARRRADAARVRVQSECSAAATASAVLDVYREALESAR